MVRALDRAETRDAEVKKMLGKVKKESLGVQNQVVNEAAGWLYHYKKQDLKRLLKESKDSWEDIDEDEIKPYITLGDLVMEKFKVITLETHYTDNEKMLCFNKYCYLDDKKKLRQFISNNLRNNNLSYKSTRSEVFAYVKDQTLMDAKDLNFDPNVMIFKNGILDFNTLKFRRLINEGDPVPEGWSTDCFYKKPEEEFYFFELDVPFDVDHYHDCPKFKKAVVGWIDEKCKDKKGYRKKNRKLLLNDIFEMMALCMTTRVDLKAAFLNYGKENCGKTQFYHILSYIIGAQNMSGTSLQRLGKNEFGAEGLQFKLLNYCGDLPSLKILDTGLFKSITGGDRQVESEEKGGSKHTVYITVKFWFNANEIPRLGKGTDTASYDRFIMIHFPNQFLRTDDEYEGTFSNTITGDPNEIQGIVRECVKAYHRLITRGNFREVLRENTMHTWRYHSDKVYAFVHDHCELKKGRIECKEFVEAANEIFPGIMPNTITRGLQRMGVFKKQGRYKVGHPKAGNQADFYRGIQWKDIELIHEMEGEKLIDEF